MNEKRGKIKSAIRHAGIPAVLTVYIMNIEGNPLSKEGKVVWLEEHGQMTENFEQGRVKIELLQGDYVFRAQFMDHQEERFSLPVTMDIEPQDDEEIDIIAVGALDRVLGAQCLPHQQGAEIISLNDKGQKYGLSAGDILTSVDEILTTELSLAEIDYKLGERLRESAVTLSFRSADTEKKIVIPQ